MVASEIVFATGGKNPMVWLEWRAQSARAEGEAGASCNGGFGGLSLP